MPLTFTPEEREFWNRIEKAFIADAKARGIDPYAHSIDIPIPPTNPIIQPLATAASRHFNDKLANLFLGDTGIS